jgi:hypothetical protein
MILIFICCFVRLFNKDVCFSTYSDFPLILDGQFCSECMDEVSLLFISRPTVNCHLDFGLFVFLW